MQAVHYTVTPADPAAHLFHVRLTVRTPDPQGQVVSLPAWIPGSYLIRDFAKNVVSIRATDAAGAPLALERLDKDTWRCAPCEDELHIECEIYAWDASVRAAYLDTVQGFFNGTSLFLRVRGREREPCGVTLQAPGGERGRRWRVATALPRAGADPLGFGDYQAADYDELIDHPVGLGEFTLAAFEVRGVPHEIALFGVHRADTERLCADLARVCDRHVALFEDEPPMDYYLFLVKVTGEGYGGLEHRASTALVCTRDSLPRPGRKGVDERYREFLGLCSHEYFHSWNVKRIRPAAFTPYDLQRENYTELLWAFEGITSYYDDLGLLRAGLVDPAGYLELLGQTITRVLRGKGRLRQSVTESSFYAWTKFYQQDENAPNAIVSYYAKGALVALCLDLLIRRHTDNNRSLDDVMRLLWRRHGVTAEGVPEDGVEAAVLEIAGADLADFLHRALRTTEELPLESLLRGAGVRMRLRAAESQKDKGGKPGSNRAGARNGKPRAELGARLETENGVAKVGVVGAGGAARAAGLSAGDVIVACNGLKTNVDRLEAEIACCGPGDTLRLHAFRRDELMEFTVTLKDPELTTCYLEIDPDAGGAELAVRECWLKAGG